MTKPGEQEIASAKAARQKVGQMRREMTRHRKAHTLDDSTRFRRFVKRALVAMEIRVDAEERIAEMYEAAAAEEATP